MEPEEKGTDSPPVARAISRNWLWMPLILLFLGIFSFALLFWSMKINERQRINFALSDAIMDLQLQVHASHLWFEEAIDGDTAVDIEAVWNGFEEGQRLAEVMIQGGETRHGLYLEPIQDQGLREETDCIKGLVTQLRTIAQERRADPARGGVGSSLDEQFDAVFTEVTQRSGALELLIERDQIQNQEKSTRLFLGIMAFWTGTMAASFIGYSGHERHRRTAETALRLANARLQAQTEELEKHRLHLVELVEERAAELNATNLKLQKEINDHQQTIEALRESGTKFERLSMEFHVLLDAIPDSLTLLSPDLKVLWANSGAVAACGRAEQLVPGMCCSPLGGDGTTSCPECPALRTFKTGKPENCQVSSDDGAIWDVRAFPISDKNGRVRSVIEVATDVTAKVSLQAESARMAHLASLGELAAGVAHEINNPVNGIINYAQILLDETDDRSETRDILTRIIKEGDRIASIVRSLLSLAHENSSEKVHVHVGDILSDALALAGRQLERDGITLRVDVPEQLPEILASSQQIAQVFLNVITNARHALNDKYPGPHESKVLDIIAKEETTRGRREVRIAFHDRGIGIPAAILGKVLDPFYSTKPRGVGTGLGLSISHGIVRDHGGSLTIQSTEGEYTVVLILLPVEGGRDG
ncbi:MAG: ATP-binding protein [Syntrophobacteraceae bacterium]